MAWPDRLCFVQFLHPGGEHGQDAPGIKRWNTSAHARKFLIHSGHAVRGHEHFSGPLTFWGEWEPPSTVAPLQGGDRWQPRFVHRPQLPLWPTGAPAGLRNTDPYVFGGFFYTGCQQSKKTGPTQLRYLDRGSVVLFGSGQRDPAGGSRARMFVVDTVFVVADYSDHDPSSVKDLRGAVPEGYFTATLDPWYAEIASAPSPRRDARGYRLYRGATEGDPIDGMFSFVPCRPSPSGVVSFPRPALRLPAIVTPSHNQGCRLNPQTDRARVRALWQDVVAEVERQGDWLGTLIDPVPSVELMAAAKS